MNLYTIGFAQKTAKEFFELLKKNNVKRLLDIRESNSNIYAGFTMKQNLPYFLEQICGITYHELKIFAPTKELKKFYQESKNSNWEYFEQEYKTLLKERSIHEHVDSELLRDAVLLCAEPEPENCHRKIAAEYLKNIFPEIRIIHL